LSNYFDNRYLTKSKILIGTSLLVLINVTPGCKRHIQVTCYEPSAPDDTIEIQRTQPDEPLDVTCYASTLAEPEVNNIREEMPELPDEMNTLPE
jgi:hypothetical protein